MLTNHFMCVTGLLSNLMLTMSRSRWWSQDANLGSNSTSSNWPQVPGWAQLSWSVVFSWVWWWDQNGQFLAWESKEGGLRKERLSHTPDLLLGNLYWDWNQSSWTILSFLFIYFWLFWVFSVWGLLSSCGGQAVGCVGFRSCGSRALEHWLSDGDVLA